MSSFNRRILLLSLAALSGCGFRPAYGPKGGAQVLQGRVLVDPPKDENDFALVQRLEQRLGAPEVPAYALSLKLTLSQEGLAITPTQEITRYHVLGKAGFVLKNVATGRVLTTGSVDNFTSYSATGTTVSTLTAKRDAYRRLMTILADQIVTRLLAATVPAT